MLSDPYPQVKHPSAVNIGTPFPEDLQHGTAGSDSARVADIGNTSRLVRRHRTAKEDG